MKEIKNYDSEFCGSLPIHMINVVQPYGALIVVNKELNQIIQVSENIATLINRPLNELPGIPITDLMQTVPVFHLTKNVFRKYWNLTVAVISGSFITSLRIISLS